MYVSISFFFLNIYIMYVCVGVQADSNAIKSSVLEAILSVLLSGGDKVSVCMYVCICICM